MAADIDPITFAVVRNGLISAAREMYWVFKRTTMLPIIYEYNDFGMSLFDDDFNMVADAPGIPIFLGSLDTCIDRTLAELGGRESLKPGDVLFNNHPYLTAGQPADAAVIQPIFHKDRLIGFAALRAHMGDFGGKNTYPVDTTELYQEGTLFPGVKLCNEGKLDSTLVRLLRANSRIPNETVGSIIGGTSAVRACTKKVLALVDKYGLDTYYAVVRRTLAHGEQLAREAIQLIPDGTYFVEDYLDSNGVTDEPVKINCKVCIDGSDIVIDLSGSAEQQEAPINCPWGYTLTTCRFALKRLTNPEVPPSSGDFRPLTVIAPEGSLFNPTPPAPCFIGLWSSLRLSDMVVRALAPAMPHSIPADNGGDLAICSAWLRHPVSNRWCLFCEFGGLGMGAVEGRDGMNALIHPIEAGCESLPAELIETKMPILKRRWELQCDSGGPGKFRGGLSTVVEYEFLNDGIANVITEKTKPSLSPVGGLADGLPAPFNNLVTLFPGTNREMRLGKKSDIPVTSGDVFILRAAGGGGYGDPLERTPEQVADDVRNGYVSAEAAETVYGIKLDASTGNVSAEASRQLRSRIRAARRQAQASVPERDTISA
jgi:N-methylhydantoinase B